MADRAGRWPRARTPATCSWSASAAASRWRAYRPSVESVDVVELEPEVIVGEPAGSRACATSIRCRTRAFNVVINDARNALKLTGNTYDAIVSQPSHPWTAGASHLFTRQFAAEVRSHLNDGGVFLQWMNAEFVDEAPAADPGRDADRRSTSTSGSTSPRRAC